jgi:tetrathionate reductase subunit B
MYYLPLRKEKTKIKQFIKKDQKKIRTDMEQNKKISSRRKFVKTGGAALVGMAASKVGLSAVNDKENIAKNKKPRRLAMVIDLDRCLGCNACSVSCKAENGVRLGGFRSWVSEKETGRYPIVTRAFLPRLCNHCEKPACQKVCPVGATYKRDDGLVAINKSKCIGCRYCMAACPYGVRYFNPRRDSTEARLFPARTYGTVDKCDFCVHRVDNGIVPSCVNTCIANARVFGDLNDPEGAVNQALKSDGPVTLLPEFGTGPSVFYKGGQPKLFKAKQKG